MLDYETRKALEEAWLCEMALERKDANKLCMSLMIPLRMHLGKCFLFHNTQWYNHWLKECGNWCVKCDDIRLKPKAKRPDKKFFLQDGFICDEIETVHDAQLILDTVILNCSEIGRDDTTKEEALRFLDFWSELRIELADYFSDEDSFDRSVYMSIVDEAIKRHTP